MADRVIPHSVEAEVSVLGAMLIDPDAIVVVAERLRPDDFYRKSHSIIYQSMMSLYGDRKPVDILTVSEALDRSGDLESVGGRAFLAGLSSNVPTAVHVAEYAAIIEQKAIYRKMISAAGRVASIAYDQPDNLQDAIDAVEGEILGISTKRAVSEFSPLGPVMQEVYDHFEKMYNNRGRPSGVPSGFPELDRMTAGFQPSDLIIIAARPSVGKTSLALNVAEHAALREGKSVGIFSLEMSREQLVMRLISSVADVDSRKLRSGYADGTDFAKVAAAMQMLNDCPIYIDDSPSMSSATLRTKARRLQAEFGLDLVIVDYLQLMNAPGKESRVQEVTEISRGLKAMARDLNIPVIALSQLSRQPEARADPEPKLSDLRDSGAIEQDADVVALMWRDNNPDMVHLRVAKHRNGPIGEMQLRFLPDRTRFQ